MYIHRRLETMLRRALRYFPAVAVTGPRQSGKSTMLKTILKDYRYLSFDDLSVMNRAASDPNLFLETAGDRVIFDEIQYFPEITRGIKTLIDQKPKRKGCYVLTGSTQFPVIKNLSETLAGRVAILNLMPFDSLEYSKGTSPVDAFSRRCLFTSFPDPLLRATAAQRDLWATSYLKTYIEKDIRMVHDIGSLRDFQRFIQLLAARVSNLLNLSDFAKELGVTVKTLGRWLSILEASFMVTLLPPYHTNLGKRIHKHPKLYFTDCGLAAFLIGIRTREQLLASPFAGPLFENYCVQEIIKCLAHSQISQPRLFFYRTNYGLEVDLLIELQLGKVIPVEIKFTSTPKASMVKNLELFIHAAKPLTIRHPSLICNIRHPEPLTRNIIATPLGSFWDILLSRKT